MCKMLADIKKTRQLFKIIWLFACNLAINVYIWRQIKHKLNYGTSN